MAATPSEGRHGEVRPGQDGPGNDPAMNSTLSLEEGVLLGTAFFMRLAARRQIRVLSIKGPALSQLGLRTRRNSVDIDLWVEPGRFVDMCQEAEAVGWKLEPVPPEARILPRHSRVLTHPRWPCEVDLHHHFPGFLESTDRVFDVLWDRRITVPMAGTRIWTTDPIASALITGLNASRDPDERADELNYLVKVISQWGGDELHDLTELASATGCLAPLRPVFRRIPPLDHPDPPPSGPEMAAWEVRTKLGTSRALSWTFELRHTNWRGYGKFTLRAWRRLAIEVRRRRAVGRPGPLNLFKAVGGVACEVIAEYRAALRVLRAGKE